MFEKIRNSKIEKMKIENCTILTPRETFTVAVRAVPGDLGLKSHPKDYQQKVTYHYGHPSKYRPKPMLLNLSALGGWQQWYANSN